MSGPVGLDLSGPLLLVIAALSVAAEPAFVVGLVLPGASALIGIGLLVALGELDLWVALMTAGVAAVVGGQLGYRLGRHTRLPARWDHHRLRAAALFDRLGPCALWVTQWVVGARTLAPRLAAAAGFGLRRFAAAQVPAALLWSSSLVTAGAALAEHAGRVGTLLAVGAVVVGLSVRGARSAFVRLRVRAHGRVIHRCDREWP